MQTHENLLPMIAADTAAPNGFIAKTHVSLNVRDIERSAAFYEGFFGVPAHKRRPGYANFDLANPPLKLALQEAVPADGLGALSHLGIQVGTAAEVQAVRERLVASGLASFDEGDTICCYARQDKIWAHDPDHNGWEVYVLLDEMNDEEDDHFHQGEPSPGVSACCAASAQSRAGGPDCCAQPADASPCCP